MNQKSRIYDFQGCAVIGCDEPTLPEKSYCSTCLQALEAARYFHKARSRQHTLPALGAPPYVKNCYLYGVSAEHDSPFIDWGNYLVWMGYYRVVTCLPCAEGLLKEPAEPNDRGEVHYGIWELSDPPCRLRFDGGYYWPRNASPTTASRAILAQYNSQPPEVSHA